MVVHVTNNIPDNGTTIHWHGVRQLNSVGQDGVPGVTQCPIAPNEELTYNFKITQYGSTWYHSHFTLQYADGLYGGLVSYFLPYPGLLFMATPASEDIDTYSVEQILNGPATADYDEDLGMLSLGDWDHASAFDLWSTQARQGGPPTMHSGLINGTNTYNCTASSDTTCTGVLGKKYETVFEAGKKYRIRLVNVATDGHFQFSIDGHNLTVIGTDLVPIVPYATDSVLVSIGQRVDVIVEATAGSGDFWLRGGWVSACSTNLNPADITGIVRYDSSSTADPTSVSTVVQSSACGDEPLASIVPYLSLDVGDIAIEADEDLSFNFGSAFTWTINGSSLWLNWSNPTVEQVMHGEQIFPTEYNVVAVNVSC